MPDDGRGKGYIYVWKLDLTEVELNYEGELQEKKLFDSLKNNVCILKVGICNLNKLSKRLGDEARLWAYMLGKPKTKKKNGC